MLQVKKHILELWRGKQHRSDGRMMIRKLALVDSTTWASLTMRVSEKSRLSSGARNQVGRI